MLEGFHMERARIRAAETKQRVRWRPVGAHATSGSADIRPPVPDRSHVMFPLTALVTWVPCQTAEVPRGR